MKKFVVYFLVLSNRVLNIIWGWGEGKYFFVCFIIQRTHLVYSKLVWTKKNFIPKREIII